MHPCHRSVLLTSSLYTSRRYHFRQIKWSVVHITISNVCDVQTYKYAMTNIL